MPHPLAPLRDAGPYLIFVNCLPSGLLRAHGAPVAIHRAAKLTKTSSDATQLPSRNFLEGPSRVPVGQSVWLRKRTVNREPNRSGTGRLRTGTNRTANYSYANRMGTNRTANYSYANRMEPNRFHILKKVILSASGGSENDFRELKIKLERGINCNEWIPAQHNLPKCCRNCK